MAVRGLERYAYLVAAVQRRRPQEPPEKGLYRAVLAEAISCAVAHHVTSAVHKAERRQAVAEAWNWIMADGTAPDWPFSFDNVCFVIGEEPDCLRRLILEVGREFGTTGAVA